MATTVTNTNSSGKSDSVPEVLGNSRWWDKPVDPKAPEQVHGMLVPYVGGLMAAWAAAEWDDRVHDAMYENRSLRGMKNARNRLAASGFDPSRLMVTTSIVDTFESRFARRKTMPMFVVDGAQWSLKQKAAGFRKLLHGKMMETKTDRKKGEARRDGLVRGTGILYIDEGEEDVIVERVHRWEVFVDPHEAKAGPDAVRQKHRVRRVAREVLLAEYPEHAAAIKAANPSTRRQYETVGTNDDGSSSGWTTNPDIIDLYESWHIPSGCDVEDGRKAVCIENATLAFEKWDRPRFPFAVIRRHRRQDGYWGQGDVERLAPDQRTLDKMAAAIERNIDVNSDLVLITNEMQDATPTEKLTGRGPRRIRVRGSVDGIKYHVPVPVAPAHLSLLDTHIARMHDFSGVSQWSAQGRSPLGNGASGVALDTMEDIQSDRHARYEQDEGNWTCDIAQLILDACRAIVKRREETPLKEGETRKKFGARWMEGGTLHSLDWDDVAMDEEQYQLQIEPISYLPTTRGGKLAAVTELTKSGIIPQQHAAALFDEPDIAQFSRVSLAKYNRALAVMEIIGDPAKEVPMPEPQWDLALHLEFALAFYNMAQNDGAPEEVQARYRDYADSVQDEMDKGKSGMVEDAAGPPMPGAPPMDPMAPPMPGAPAPMTEGMPMPGAPAPMTEGMPMPPMPPGLPV